MTPPKINTIPPTPTTSKLIRKNSKWFNHFNMNDGEFISYYSTINSGIIVKAFRLIFILMQLSKMQGVGRVKIIRNSHFNYKNYRNSGLGVPLYNKWVSRYGFLKEMWPNPQFSAYLVNLTEEIFHGKLQSSFFYVPC